MITKWLVGRQWQRGEDFPKKKPRAELRVNLHRAFAVPAEAGVAGKISFEHRAGVDVQFLHAPVCAQGVAKLAQLRLHEIMIIVAPGIFGDDTGGGRKGGIRRVECSLEGGRSGGFDMVVLGHHDHGLHARKDEGGVGAAFRLARHPRHVAVLSVVEPLLENIGMGSAVDGGDAAVIETQRAGGLQDF